MTLSLLMLSVGCDDTPRLPKQPGGQNAAQANRDPNERYGRYTYGMRPSDVSDEFGQFLDDFADNARNLDAEFEKTVKRLREESSWLDRSLEDPIDAPLLTEEGTLPGPTAHEEFESIQPMFDAFVEDYRENSADTDEEKQLKIDDFQKVLIPAICGSNVDDEAMNRIIERFKAGDLDPITVVPTLEYDDLNGNVRQSCQRKIIEVFDHRQCSSLTKLMVVYECSTKSGNLTFQGRVRCAEEAIESVEDVLREYHSFGSPMDYIFGNCGSALNPAGNIDYLKRIFEVDDNFVPEHLKHFLVSKIHERIAGNARGGNFMGEVSQKNIQIFADSSRREAAHLLKAWTLAPRHSAIAKKLFDNELRSGSTPLSPAQWYRLALLTQADSRNVTKSMARTLQHRWGGSQRQLEQFTIRLLEHGQKSKARFLFDVPFGLFAQDTTWSVNLADESTLDDAIVAFLDALEKKNGEKPDERLTPLQLTHIARVLWDAGDLDRLGKLFIRYRPKLYSNWLYNFRMPVWLYDRTMTAREELPSPAWAVLQRELLVGKEQLDEARKNRIEKSLASIRELVAKQEPPKKVEKETAIEETNGQSDEKVEPKLASSENEEKDSRSADEQDESAEPKTDESSDSDEAEQTSAAFMLETFEELYDVLKRYHNGETVDLIGDPHTWTSISSDVEFLEGSIKLTANFRDRSPLLIQPLRFAPPMVVELDVTQEAFDGDPYGIGLFAGPIGPHSTSSPYSGRSLRYSPGFPKILQDDLPGERLRGSGYVERTLWPVPRWAILRMEVRSSGIRSYLNGDLITETKVPTRTGGYLSIGRVAGDQFTGVPSKKATYTLHALRISKLKKNSVYQPMKPIALETAKSFASENLDLDDRKLEDFATAVYETNLTTGEEVLLVQFAHKVNRADAIYQYGIKPVKGGFPDYFTVTTTKDGTKVIEHLAESGKGK